MNSNLFNKSLDEFESLYNFIQSLSSQDIFKYSIILILSIAFFSKYSINLGFLLGIGIALGIIIYLHQRKVVKSDSYDHLHNDKVNNIRPKPINFDDKNDVIDLVYNLQDFFYDNPQVFEEMIDNLNIFFKVYDDTMIGRHTCSQNYEIAKSKMHNAVNSLHSIIYSLDSDKDTNSKFNRATKQMYKVLSHYLDKINAKCEEHLIRNGYNVTTKLIEHNQPKPFNFYLTGKKFSWDFF